MHDVGLTRIPQNTMCFEVEGGEIARRFLERAGLPADRADTVAVAILLHMQPGVTLADGAEACSWTVRRPSTSVARATTWWTTSGTT